MKKIIICAFCAFCVTLTANAQKFGHVNSMEIIQLMPESAKLQADLKSRSEQYQKEYQGMQEELKKNYEEFQKLDPNTPEAIRNRKQQSLIDQNQKLEQFANDCQQELAKVEAEGLQAMRTKLLKAVQEIGVAGNYVYIMDISSGIPYISTSLSTDLTADVKKKLGL